MKNLFTLVFAVLLTANVFSQAPEKISYQAVIRDGANNLLTAQVVGVQITILKGGANGTAVYIETQTPTTNDNGLISLEIGTGTLISGSFNTIDWANGIYFIKIETDPAGGSNYSITGTSQLMSVPYALHSKTTDSIKYGDLTFETPSFMQGSGTFNSASIITSATYTTIGNKVTVFFSMEFTNVSTNNSGQFGIAVSFTNLPAPTATSYSGNVSFLTSLPAEPINGTIITIDSSSILRFTGYYNTNFTGKPQLTIQGSISYTK